MKYFDLHCDTPFECYKRQTALDNNEHHISLHKAKLFESYAQIMAIWTQHSLENEETWEQFFSIQTDFLSKLPPERVALCLSRADYQRALSEGKRAFFLAVEGASLLNDKLGRVDELYRAGVRFLTLVWQDEDCIGGAFNTDKPLTDFGREVVKRCFFLGITVDVSHASDAVIDECLALAKEYQKPIIATHSDSRTVFDHPRNLTDEHAKQIAACGGLVGISMAPQHLDAPGKANVESICRHIRHYLSLGLENTLAFGCDFDGIDQTPAGICNISDMTKIGETLFAEGISEKTIQAIFWDNAERFVRLNL